jgi:hypothetical protein
VRYDLYKDLLGESVMQVTVDVPEDVITQLGAWEQALPEAIAIGLQELTARPQDGFNGFAEVLEFLAALPTPEEILTLRPSLMLQAQIDRLSERYQAEELTSQEKQLWKQYEYLEHIVSIAKAKAYIKIKQSSAV